MPLSQLALFRIMPKPISINNILSVIASNPRKICFRSCHSKALKLKINNFGVGTFNLPFDDSIKYIFEEKTKIKLDVSKFGGFWVQIKNNEDYQEIKNFTEEFSYIVFIKDCLELSIALSDNFLDTNKRTEIGQLEFEAKYNKNETALQQLIAICNKWLKKLPFYKDSDYICAIPPSRKEDDNLPNKIIKKLSGHRFVDISNSVSWSKTKVAVKSMECSKKLEYLASIGIDINIDLHGKIVILFDDLYQSGITMQYVAMKMKNAGASKVFGLTIVKSRSNTDNT